jgi:hypothetical protein
VYWFWGQCAAPTRNRGRRSEFLLLKAQAGEASVGELLRRHAVTRTKLFAFLALVLTAALPLTVRPARAQTVTASITGVVTDASGAVIPGVQVKLSNPATGVSYSGVTNASGSYTIVDVKPGPGYIVRFTMKGFEAYEVTGIYLNVAVTRTQDARLAVGAQVQTVTVSGSNQNVTLNTTDATIGNNVEVQELNQLPVLNRDAPTALFYMEPGVTLSGAVTGARTDQSNVTVDGLDVNDQATGQFGAIVALAPVDSVQEFRGTVGGNTADSGQGGGGQYQLVTKSGTNHFHGALVEYHRDANLEANDWFNNNDGTPRPPLIRNQFGGNVGGPIMHDRLFFFFDYNGRRDTLSSLVTRTVPVDSYRNGNIAYMSSSGPSTLDPAQVAQLDPTHVGFDASLLSLMNSRFPHANDFSGDAGDGLNTAGFRFNAPYPYSEDDFVQRIDYNMNSKMKMWAKGAFARRNAIESAVQFPGDPVTAPFYDRSYNWVVGHTWTISTNKLNQAIFGVVHEDYNFSKTYNPQGVNQFGFTEFDGFYESGSNSQARTYNIPVVRDDFTWDKGRHTLTFGGTFKWLTPNEYAAENFNFPNVGVTGNTNFTALNPTLRPSDINSNYTTVYDNAFSTALGTFASVSSNFNYNNKQQVQPQGSGLDLIYRNYETELYLMDNWKVTPSLTLTYGLRYQNYTVPYETRGEESIPNIGFDQYWGDRLKQSAAGIVGVNALPFIQYSLGGKANNKPGYYQPQNKDFAPRFAFAWNPAFDRKTVFTGGAGVIYDYTIVNALQFQQLQSSYLFESSNTNLFGAAGDPVSTIETAPRFAGIGNAPTPPAAPTITLPYTPFVTSSGYPYGLPYGEFNIMINPQLKTPYNIELNFGVQHQFPEGYLLRVTYDGRLGRRLLAEADASQLIDFPDNTGGSSQMMSAAMAGMETQLRGNAGLGALGAIQSLTPQPWFEDMLPGFSAYANGIYGAPYTSNNTQAVALLGYPYPQRGDFADAMYEIAANGFLPPNAAMPVQFAGDTVWTNKGSSAYNGLLVTLHKNAGHGLQFDLNYTWAHSIDNVSFIANSIASASGYGYICDINRPRECRGNSDFDVTNYLNGDFIYELPFGRNRAFASGVSRWLNEAIGDWGISGLPTWHTGVAYSAFSNAYVAGFANDAPATLTGAIADMKTKIHKGSNGTLYAYADPAKAVADYTGPTGFNIGSRNNLRGPGYFNMDLSLGKAFAITEDWRLVFRTDAFNALNHPNFEPPDNGASGSGNDITEASGVQFGTISSTVVPPSSDIAARVLQLSLRLEF